MKKVIPDQFNWRGAGFPSTPVKRKPRLTIKVRDNSEIWKDEVDATVWLDNKRLLETFYAPSEPEARAAAESYVEELIKHFQEGGR